MLPWQMILAWEHPCFVSSSMIALLMQGCDGSVLLDDTANFTGEKTALPNFQSLRGFDVIDNIKAALEKACPGVVSCADIVVAAAQYGVLALGGPSWNFLLGRRDSTTANLTAANMDIPSPFLNLSGLIASFANKGFTTQEMVTLSGAHTIGQARCILFRNRIYNETNINPIFAAIRRTTCTTDTATDNNLAPLDITTPIIFDNKYYSNLLLQEGLLHSDQQLFNATGGSTNSQVLGYTLNPIAFRTDFASAMVKMGNLSVLTGTNGQIRLNCRKVNS
ncbi:hypothetical protein SLEP1_g14702 [Rubroshorea leprosula]|uniref:peroxidase n=1 Tax=Rubroshorea leprosula TaxID=152421 RepID=A0AAV5IPC5_9ROSI|nr:hypothetical protein SLEP1_g14702 [Rubroshorea leprosula]